MVAWALDAKLEKRDTVELEMAHAAAARLLAWATFYGKILGIPLALLVLTLSLLGIGNYVDFRKAVTDAHTQITDEATRLASETQDVMEELEAKRDEVAALASTANEQGQQLESAVKKANEIDDVLSALKDQLAELEELQGISEEKLDTLNKEVEVIKDFGLGKAKLLSSDLRGEYDEAIGAYIDYLEEIGLERPRSNPKVYVLGEKNKAGFNAFYMPGDKYEGVYISQKLLSKDVALRECTHSVLIKSNSSATLIYGVVSITIETALADYLTRSYLDKSTLDVANTEFDKDNDSGFPSNLETKRSFFDAQSEDIAGAYETAHVVASALWEIRNQLSREVLDPILANTWKELPKMDDDITILQAIRVFRDQLLKQDSLSNLKENHATIVAVFAERGLEP